jgi:hypothetical protein
MTLGTCPHCGLDRDMVLTMAEEPRGTENQQMALHLLGNCHRCFTAVRMEYIHRQQHEPIASDPGLQGLFRGAQEGTPTAKEAERWLLTQRS